MYGFVMPQRVPTKFMVHGEEVTFAEVPCAEQGCARCQAQRGGWAFRWVDARWTPEAVLELDPERHQAMMREPWPVGLAGGRPKRLRD